MSGKEEIKANWFKYSLESLILIILKLKFINSIKKKSNEKLKHKLDGIIGKNGTPSASKKTLDDKFKKFSSKKYFFIYSCAFIICK